MGRRQLPRDLVQVGAGDPVHEREPTVPKRECLCRGSSK
jgi:hypothetical protein